MSEVVDRWVERLKGKLPPVGEMTHWERMAAAFDLKPADLVPVAPELDYWQITYAGYSHQEIYNDVDKTTDACLKTWADLRTDAIWMYVDISHQIENFIPAERRPEHFIHRGAKDYLLFKPLAKTLDEAIALYETRAFEKYIGDSRAVTHYTPHMLQLLEFQEKMDRVVPVIVGIATPSNYAETLVEVQQFVRWTVTEPKEKVRHYLDLALEERLAALDFYAEFAAKNGCAFCCLFGGARTWGPRQLAELGYADERFVEKATRVFPYVFWHICGHNLPEAMQTLTEWPGIKAVQYDMPYYSQKLTYPEWFESVARLFAGKRCAMNSPTTQLACHGTADEVRHMVRDFIECTTPHTTAVVMPGCEVDSYSPLANVQAMIEVARERRASARV
jgi:uroporphyrinogen-III decarboxylase